MPGSQAEKDGSDAPVPRGGCGMRIEDSVKLSREILHWANRGLPRTDFLHEVSKVLMDSTGCDAVEIRLNDGDLHYRWEAARRPESAVGARRGDRRASTGAGWRGS